MTRARRSVVLGLVLSCAPALVWIWLLVDPRVNRAVVLPSEHFLIVTLVSLLAAGVALFVVRIALALEQYQVLLIALGFMSMAAFFTVHALATPGVHAGMAAPPSSDPYDYAVSTISIPTPIDYSSTLIGASAFLSLSIPSVLFAAGSHPGISAGLRQRVPSRVLAIGVVAVPLAYGALAAWQPALVSNSLLSRPPAWYALMLLSGVVLLCAALLQARAYAATRFPVHGAMVLALVLLAQAQVLVVLATFWTLAWWSYHLLMLAGVVIAMGALLVELDRRRGLERFLAREVVERAVSGDLLRGSGERREVTILFADLRGSTALADQLTAEEVVALLNTYVGAMARCVFAHGGMLDKFLGDGLMAIFGVLADPTCGAVPAARAALDIRAAIRGLNAYRPAPLQCGVGIHTGNVVLGAVGIPQRSDFTAIGDTVNTASRLEGQCKELGVDIVLSTSTAALLPSSEFTVVPLGHLTLRGKQEPMGVATLG